MKDRSFLKCAPCISAFDSYYEIMILTKGIGMALVEVGDKVYRETRSGVHTAESDFFKIRVPQAALDVAKEYTVIFRASKGKKSYFTEFCEHECVRFDFHPVEKTEGVKIYHVADVHYNFDSAKSTVDYFGDEIDLFVINGDIAEAQEVENYHDELIFLGEIGKGRVPMVFARGNHDTRGSLAERYRYFAPYVIAVS